jgi:hypothetical protein
VDDAGEADTDREAELIGVNLDVITGLPEGAFANLLALCVPVTDFLAVVNTSPSNFGPKAEFLDLKCPAAVGDPPGEAVGLTASRDVEACDASWLVDMIAPSTYLKKSVSLS